VLEAPIYSLFGSIYPGPHRDAEGRIDPRVWFNIQIESRVDDGTITYLIFPYGGSEDEVHEVTISATGSWIA
jgi:hypothetical protein